jgi:hypothetical protein
MFPVAVDRLSISQIADYWASEIVIGDSKLRDRREINICDLLVSAWWRGELTGMTRRTRMEILKSLFPNWDDEISFLLPGKWQKRINKREGGIRLWLTVPNADANTWTEENCEETFTALATKWQRLRGKPDADPVIESTEPTDGYRVLAW